MDGSWSRVLVLGGGGAGKCTVARRLGARLGLPVVHLDAEYWQPGWTAPDPDAWRARVTELAAAPRWVMEGNYGSTLDIRAPLADLAVVLDLPRRIALPRVLRRTWRHRGGTRPDMGADCPEKIDLEFVRWIWTYRRRVLPQVQETLRAVVPPPQIVHLRSARATRTWLAG